MCFIPADDCMEMVHQLNFGEEDESAKEWLKEAEKRSSNSSRRLSAQVQKFKLHYGKLITNYISPNLGHRI